MIKPTFNVSQDGRTVEVDGKIYSHYPIINKNFHELRQANYGNGFRQVTLGEILTFRNASCLNDNNGLIISKLTGNTSALCTHELTLVQDMPEVKDGKLVMDEQRLVSKLGSYNFEGVRFSDDRRIRVIDYNIFDTGDQNPEQIRKNPFIIALTGDESSPEKLAKIIEKSGKQGFVAALKGLRRSEKAIRIPCLIEYEHLNDFGLGFYHETQFGHYSSLGIYEN